MDELGGGVFLEATVEDLTAAACRRHDGPWQSMPRPIVAELTEALTSDDEAA